MPKHNPNGNAKAVMLTLQAFRDMLRAGRPSTPQAPLLVPADRPSGPSVSLVGAYADGRQIKGQPS